MARQAGFTLLELLAVLGVVGVLLGIGIGFLQRGTTDLDAALLSLSDQVRVASTTARARGLPTELEVAGGDAARAAAVRVRGLRHVGSWHFEDGERPFDRRLAPQLSGAPEPGRFGQARRPDLDGGSALLTVAAAGDVFALEAGFALRLDARADGYGEAVLARLGRTLELRLGPRLVPTAKATLAGAGNQPGLLVEVEGLQPLPLDRWVTVEVVHDGAHLSLAVDGRDVDRVPARGVPFAEPASFEVCPPDAPLDGLVDEVQLFAYELGEAVLLPPDVELDPPPPWRLRFDRTGELVEPKAFAFAIVLPLGDDEERIARRIAPGGVLQPADGAAVAAQTRGGRP